ncbi:PQQ-like beta-propeller repeat protein [Flavobacterium sp. AC]|uniref:PQQ-like beta-propeller repeat protein n=1 Tax=Flavobacterium azizsancarii TaxID=2961580 RepID=A0ABT4WCJ4_9FLAO|nr:PQQ-binding-like beta-propeller repeat protein [Flavobacterium azizsancarii]MDA6070181.1 PQQ-like beta-propeller repeat protein [Flavobacterium azizsancarii]
MVVLLLLFYKFFQLDTKTTISNFNKVDNYICYVAEDTILVVKDLNDEKVLEKNLSNSFGYKPLIFNDKIFFSESNDVICCWDLKTKKVLWKQKTPNIVKAIIKLNEKTILINIKNYGFMVFNSEHGEVLYNILRNKDDCHSPDLSPYPVIVDNNNFYISNWNCNSISSFDISNGKVLWSKKLEDGIYTSLLYEDYIFLGFNNSYENGGAYLVEKETGIVVFKKQLLFEERLKPLIKNNKVFFYTYDKKLNEFDFKTRTDKVVGKFTSSDDISGGQMYLIDNNIFFQDSNFDVFKFNLLNYKKELIGKSDFGGIEEVYKKNNQAVIVFPDNSRLIVEL